MHLHLHEKNMTSRIGLGCFLILMLFSRTYELRTEETSKTSGGLIKVIRSDKNVEADKTMIRLIRLIKH